MTSADDAHLSTQPLTAVHGRGDAVYDAAGQIRVMPQPCPKCPWIVDQDGTAIPHFDMAQAEDLASTCTPDPDARLFACHQSSEDRNVVCAGWLAQYGARQSIRVRMMIAAERMHERYLRFEKRPDWPALHDTWDEVLRKLRSGPLGRGWTAPPGRRRGNRRT